MSQIAPVITIVPQEPIATPFAALLECFIPVANELVRESITSPSDLQRKIVVSSFQRQVDEKSRLIIPSVYRIILGEERCWCLFSPEKPDTLMLFSAEVATALINKAIAGSDFHLSPREICRHLWLLETDDEKRTTIPNEIAEHLSPYGQKFTITLSGCLSYVEIKRMDLPQEGFFGERVERHTADGKVEIPEQFQHIFRNDRAIIAVSSNPLQLHLLSTKESVALLNKLGKTTRPNPELVAMFEGGIYPVTLEGKMLRLPLASLENNNGTPLSGTVTFSGIGKHVRIDILPDSK